MNSNIPPSTAPRSTAKTPKNPPAPNPTPAKNVPLSTPSRHGLTGQVVVLPTEELAAYELFADAMLKDLQPLGFLETQIAQSITDDAWRLNRAKALENNMYALALNDNADPVVTDRPEAERRERERDELFYAAKLYEIHIAENKTAGTSEPYDPGAHGFVIAIAQVKRTRLRDKVKELAFAAD
jgi:hypothetical protein